MKPKRSADKCKQRDLFRPELTKIIDHGHRLVKLAKAANWDRMDTVFGECYSPDKGRPAINIRLMVSLQYLKHTCNLSDGEVVSRWVENPYWQYLSGMQYFEHVPPINPSSMTRWRKRIGKAGAEALLKKTIASGLKIKAVKLHRVCVGEAAQENELPGSRAVNSPIEQK